MRTQFLRLRGGNEYKAMQATTDYLLIGLGIAGSSMALTLLKTGKTFRVIDAPAFSSATKIAAGVYHPASFRTMRPIWKGEESFELAKEFYREAEKILGASFHRERDVLRVLSSEEEVALWQKRFAEHQSRFFGEKIQDNPFPGQIDAPLGLARVQGGSVDTNAFLEALRKKLRAEELLHEELFDHLQLAIDKSGVTYRDWRAKRLIFCEGFHLRQNPFFHELPLRTVKGQVLRLHIPGLKTEQVLNREVYLLPLGNERFIAGATFERGFSDELITGKGREEIESKLRALLKAPFTVEAQHAGVRPAMPDHKPLLGMHPEHAQLALLNGVGSKGVLWSPWLAQHLLDHLEGGAPLHPACALQRVLNW